MKEVNVGIIGGGLMGKESASAFARWFVFNDMPVKPVLKAVCDLNEQVLEWYRNVETVQQFTTSYKELLNNSDIEVVYVAVPHHLHEELYIEVLESKKDLIAEKPFGVNLNACKNIIKKIKETDRFVRCSSEFPFLPGPQKVIEYVKSGKLGKLLEVKSGFHHSSDLNPNKPINWKRMVKFCGEIGVMGDLGMHAVHLPFRLGYYPISVYADLQNIIKERPDGRGNTEACDTWDNAILHTRIQKEDHIVPMALEMKRIAPSETNTWYIEIIGTEGGVKYSTKEPKTLWTFNVEGKSQRWQKEDLGFASVLETITGGIFEPGFPDCFQQMLGAYFVERTGNLGDRFGCATPEEALRSHQLFEAALKSEKDHQVIVL
ncbi:Gfo/Idh/MocA family oxidoreductase [Aquimarina sp. U1-2]|uniref:Gfo/Idh/MocA family protein n=1 Tax=Aquimarina sp. U1-2 TaxID=2823141 RepID=UPI001AECFBF6|nr:Gfo/Idh/MocA family oxidoreductase [Aquimarina sp. U1-2]MBP2832900.1 Gfo/Idh/MocA family oxidoreductase [Aquimarina sp. U1-2]